MTMVGMKHTTETKAKMAAAHRGKPHPCKTHIVSEETKRKISAGNAGKIRSAECRAQMSARNTGKKLSAEHKMKTSATMKARWNDPEKRAAWEEAATKRRGFKHTREAKAKMSACRMGENNPNWLGGISYEPYCPMFNKDLKTRIRAFFDNRCLMCGKTANENGVALSCHHVEYDKQACCDGKPVHFAALCGRCHWRTNNDRTRWEAIMHRIIDEIYDGRSYYTKDEWVGLRI